MTFLPICWYADISDCRYAGTKMFADIERKCWYADIADADINICTPLLKMWVMYFDSDKCSIYKLIIMDLLCRLLPFRKCHRACYVELSGATVVRGNDAMHMVRYQSLSVAGSNKFQIPKVEIMKCDQWYYQTWEMASSAQLGIKYIFCHLARTFLEFWQRKTHKFWLYIFQLFSFSEAFKIVW